jgi:hypothetical protein
MREYNLFVIKNEYIYFYKNKPEELYEILCKLNNLKYNFNYGITLFFQLCNKINIATLKSYLNNKYNLNNEQTFYINKVFIELKYSRIIVRSKYNYPRILKSFNCYNRNIFVVDFINKDYFWLSNFVREDVLTYI